MAVFAVTGGAGFIGSNLVHALVREGHMVRVLDDLSSGRIENLTDVLDRICFVHGDIRDSEAVRSVIEGADYCLHQAAIASVVRSVEDPAGVSGVNVAGTLHIILAARDAGVRRIVYASSSAVYGNARATSISEDTPLNPISPYGADKASCDLYARTFSDLYGIEVVGLRYFNVFGPRQNPKSQYAAVIPIFIDAMLRGERPPVEGDGLQSRDFCHVANIVHANLLACMAPGPVSGVYNVACGQSVTLLELVSTLNTVMGTVLEPDFRPARRGDIRSSQADITRIREKLGYRVMVETSEGLRQTVEWYREHMEQATQS